MKFSVPFDEYYRVIPACPPKQDEPVPSFPQKRNGIELTSKIWEPTSSVLDVLTKTWTWAPKKETHAPRNEIQIMACSLPWVGGGMVAACGTRYFSSSLVRLYPSVCQTERPSIISVESIRFCGTAKWESEREVVTVLRTQRSPIEWK